LGLADDEVIRLPRRTKLSAKQILLERLEVGFPATARPCWEEKGSPLRWTLRGSLVSYLLLARMMGLRPRLSW
jgi:hypothetical protein